MVVCGRSLGGAVAALSTWRLISEMGAIDSVKMNVKSRVGTFSKGAPSKASISLDGAEVHSIVITCSPSMRLEAGDTIFVGLTGFRPPADGLINVEGTSVSMGTATWDSETSQLPVSVALSTNPLMSIEMRLTPQNATFFPMLSP